MPASPLPSRPRLLQIPASRGLRRLINPQQFFPNTRSRRHLQLPSGLLGAIAAVVLVELGIAANTLDFTPTVTMSWKFGGEDASQRAVGQEILAAGDSLMKHGLQSRILENRLGLPTLNLAIPAATAPATYFVLKRALDAGARPQAIVIDFAPDILSGSPNEALRNWPELLTIREWFDLVETYGDSHFLSRSAIERLFPSVRSRFELRASLLAALEGTTVSYREATLDHRAHWRRNGGAHLAPKNPLFDGTISDEEHRRLLSGGFWSHRVNTRYVERLLKLTADRNIPVYWLIPPLSPALQQRRNETGSDDRYSRFIASFVERFGHVRVLDARRSGYPHHVFVDARHLDRDGATTLSVDAAEAIQRSRKETSRGTAWLKLPLHREVQAGIDLEDVVQLSQARRDALKR